jgi:cardiolipin synthase A/B
MECAGRVDDAPSLAIVNWSLLYLISEWAIRLVMLVYVPPRRSTAAARTWLLLIFLLPWPGWALYAIFGRIRVSRQRLESQRVASARIRAVQAERSDGAIVSPLDLPAHLAPAVTLAARLGDFELRAGNAFELLSDYTPSIDRLLADFAEARHHVHLLTYIFADDATGRRVAEGLAAAAARGVSCTVLMDAVGSKHALRRLAPRMREQGIEVHAMLPVGFLRRNAARFDLRNHRKVAVIDGRIGYIGSQNIADAEFVRGFPNEELVARVTGPVVAQLQAVFLADCYFETGKSAEAAELFPAIGATGNSPAQLLPSGPGYQQENQQELLVALLHAARERVVIVTPYFVPDEPFLQAMCTAVRRGVAVHLVVSRHANQPVTQLAQQSYYDPLLDAGVQIHLYRPRFLHAKHFSVDDSIALIGSTNIDIRSFALNAEVSMLIYDRAVVAQLRTLEEKYFAASDRVDPAEWRRRPLLIRTAQGVARLADSLL